MENLEMLAHLCGASAPSGFEDGLAGHVAEQMRAHADRVEIDGLGNVIGWLHANHDGAPTAMLAVHMDEVGFVVRRIEESGLLRLWRVGGIPEKVLTGQVVAVCPEGRERIPGVVGGRSHHVLTEDEKYVVDRLADVFVDIGFRNQQAVAAAGVEIGTPVTWWPFFHRAGERVMGKALDNRLALWVMLDVLRRLSGRPREANLALVATVHEEWSSWGSVTSVRTVEPDLALVLDVAIASDMPGMETLTEIKLDGGPVIGTYMFHPRGPHMGTVPNPKLRRRLVETAEAAQIPYQLGTFYGGMTDSSYMQYSGRGIPVADVGIPVRYTHYPVEIASLADASAAADLVEQFLDQLPARLDLARG